LVNSEGIIDGNQEIIFNSFFHWLIKTIYVKVMIFVNQAQFRLIGADIVFNLLGILTFLIVLTGFNYKLKEASFL